MDKGLHVEERTGASSETILILVGQCGSRDGIVGGDSSRPRVRVVRQVVVARRSHVLEAKEERLHRVGEVELKTVIAGNVLHTIGLLELLNDDVHGGVLVLSALLIGNKNVLSPCADGGNLQRLASSNGQDLREVDRAGGLIHPNSLIVDDIDGSVLLDANQLSQISLHGQVLLDVVERSAAQRKGVARITLIPVGARQLHRRRRQRIAEGLQRRRVSDHLLVQRPLGSILTVLSQVIQHDRVERLGSQIVESQRALVEDVVRDIPGVGNAPGQLSIVGRVDSDLRKVSLIPGHESKVRRLGERESRRIGGSSVLHGGEEVGEPRVLLDGARKQRRNVVSAIHQSIEEVVGSDIHVSDGNVGSRLRHLNLFFVGNLRESNPLTSRFSCDLLLENLIF